MSQINQLKMIISFSARSGTGPPHPVIACFMIKKSHLSQFASTVFGMLAAGVLLALPAHAAMSDWANNEGGRMRLVALAPDADGHIRAALQIEPEPGWITYWREPGDSGIPPQVSPAPEGNVALEKVAFPVPKLITVGKVKEIGYDAPVTSRTVAIISVSCPGLCRISPLASMPFGQWTINGVAIPPS